MSEKIVVKTVHIFGQPVLVFIFLEIKCFKDIPTRQLALSLSQMALLIICMLILIIFQTDDF